MSIVHVKIDTIYLLLISLFSTVLFTQLISFNILIQRFWITQFTAISWVSLITTPRLWHNGGPLRICDPCRSGIEFCRSTTPATTSVHVPSYIIFPSISESFLPFASQFQNKSSYRYCPCTVGSKNNEPVIISKSRYYILRMLEIYEKTEFWIIMRWNKRAVNILI